jgi:hypothetical protein
MDNLMTQILKPMTLIAKFMMMTLFFMASLGFLGQFWDGPSTPDDFALLWALTSARHNWNVVTRQLPEPAFFRVTRSTKEAVCG